jgi:hypothetical protein
MYEFCTKCGTQFREGDQFCGKCGTARTVEAGAAGAGPTQAPQPVGGLRSGAPARTVKPLSLLLGILVPLGIGLVIFFGVGDCGSVEGSMQVSGARGDFTFVPTGCDSMQPYGRFGANLHGDGPNDGAVYVTVDHVSGTLVEIEVPGSCRNADGTDCTVFPVPRDRCRVYTPSVDYSGTVVNDVRLVEGSVRLECELEDGTVIQGNLTFSGC